VKTLKEILVVFGFAFLGCSVLCAVMNLLQDIGMPTVGFAYVGLSMIVCFLVMEVAELRSNEEVWDVFKKCIRSDVSAINAKISDLLMPGGAKEARHEMLKQWILAHYSDAVGKARIDFTQAFTASFTYKYQGVWKMNTVQIPAGNLANDLFESVLGPYADMMASIVMEGRDWDLFDFDDASAFFEEYHDPMENFVSVRNA
jgi:hypothetical protein